MCSLKKAEHNTSVGDEGGFTLNLNNEHGSKYFIKSIDKASRGNDFTVALNYASSELLGERSKNEYKSFPTESLASRTSIDLFASWSEIYPIVLNDDPLDQEDYAGDIESTKRLEKSCKSSAIASLSPTRFTWLKASIELFEVLQTAQRNCYTSVLSNVEAKRIVKS